MKSMRIATAVAAASLARRLRDRRRAVGSTTKTVTISVASLIPGSTPAAIQQFNAAGRAVREGEPVDQGQAGRVPVDGADVRREARGGDAADGVRGAVHRRPHARRQRPARRPDRRTRRRCRTSPSTTRRSSPRAPTRRAGSSRCRRAPTRRRCTTTASCSRRRASTRTSRRRRGRRSAPTRSRSRRRPARPATSRWRRTTTPPAGSSRRSSTRSAAGWRRAPARTRSRRSTTRRPSTALNMLHQMRWTDNSMGSNFDYGWSDINQAFAAGNVGMYISGSDVYTNLVQASNIDPSIYGLAPLPLAKNKNAGVLGGGTEVAVKPSANEAEKAAAVKWIDFFYERPLSRRRRRSAEREDARREQAAGRRSRAAALQQEAVRPREHVDQAVHQRAARPDEAVH